MEGKHILIVDDEQGILEELTELLEGEGYKIKGAGSIKEGKEALKGFEPCVVLLDLKLPDGHGLELVPDIRKVAEHAVIVVITGFGSLESAKESIQKEVFDYIEKPLNPEQIIDIVNRGSETCVAQGQKQLRVKGLETFKKVAVGREQKIISCKEEIDQLQKQIDELKQKNV